MLNFAKIPISAFKTINIAEGENGVYSNSGVKEKNFLLTNRFFCSF